MLVKNDPIPKTLFDSPHPRGPRGPKPYAQAGVYDPPPRQRPVRTVGKRAGLQRIAPHRANITAIIETHLKQAGPIKCWGKFGGSILCELTEIVAEQRNKPTKETSLTQSLKDLRLANIIIKTKQSRLGNADTLCHIYVHVDHHQSRDGNASPLTC